jgi:5-(carboxyamino)imidazole ribonucleotide synthase
MEKLVTSNLKLGIIAGGQLGKMLIQEASKWDIHTFVLDNDENCPSARIASHFVKGDQMDFFDVYQFGRRLEVVTYEIENVNIQALQKLKSEGIRVLPDPDILAMIQDKGLQKEFYHNNNIPTSPFSFYRDKQDILNAIGDGLLNYPFVQKLRTGGYDGRGVSVITDKDKIDRLLEGPSVIEEMVKIEKEIAVIVARNDRGDVRSFPPVEMVFDPVANLVEMLVCPAGIPESLVTEAEEIAGKIVKQLNYTGLLAVEFFLDTSGNLLVNESAPRPHNSGHHTIESVLTSQYEQHLRAILNLQLGSTHLKMPAVMINLLGEPGYVGQVMYEGLTESMAIEGVKIHVYGKKETWPMRKMGHATVLAETLEQAIEKAQQVKSTIKVKTWNGNA